MSPEQEKLVALTSIIENLKDNNLKIANNFKSAPPGSSKSKGKGHKQTVKQTQNGKGE